MSAGIVDGVMSREIMHPSPICVVVKYINAYLNLWQCLGKSSINGLG